ncbi:uncharacterized protein J8A68_004446 [[Candida] subhashii]|uniref:Uncharacterized protein n=1 Tax=[Candida] subhashii TaxID=561895 RepID=A0A8J5UFM7_9ASCO|nr:uncharacterized protein J8A68_004446 [[Candida] subhashii]KAG7662058.1 hypothetical protein J8A68_004446 [[Candida] subhashii]
MKLASVSTLALASTALASQIKIKRDEAACDTSCVMLQEIQLRMCGAEIAGGDSVEIIQCTCEIDEQFWLLMSDCALNCPAQSFDAPDKDPVGIKSHYCNAINAYIEPSGVEEDDVVVSTSAGTVDAATTEDASGSATTSSVAGTSDDADASTTSGEVASSTAEETSTGAADILVIGTVGHLIAVAIALL